MVRARNAKGHHGRKALSPCDDAPIVLGDIGQDARGLIDAERPVIGKRGWLQAGDPDVLCSTRVRRILASPSFQDKGKVPNLAQLLYLVSLSQAH